VILRLSILTIASALLVSGCSSLPADQRSDARDPYETSNRQIFAFNMGVDDAVIEPAAKGYRKLPEGVQTALTNHAQWTSHPSTAVNSLMQGKLENAALATIDFLINGLTLGLADLTDDADDPEREDFGQTLAAWSLPEGSYMVMPLLGPGTARSHTGFLVDAITNPLGYSGVGGVDVIRVTSAPVSVVTFRGNQFDQINDIKYNATDPYARTRSLYFQYREGQIIDGDLNASTAADDAFDSFLNEGN